MNKMLIVLLSALVLQKLNNININLKVFVLF